MTACWLSVFLGLAMTAIAFAIRRAALGCAFLHPNHFAFLLCWRTGSRGDVLTNFLDLVRPGCWRCQQAGCQNHQTAQACDVEI